MQKYTKIFLIFALLTLSLISTKFYIDKKEMQKLQHMVVKDETKSLTALFMAFRKTYQDIFIKHHIPIDKKTINFLPVRTTDEISKTFSKIVGDRATIRTVSDRPRNYSNRANSLEMGIIDYFNKNPKEKTFFKEAQDATFYYAQPLYITNSCLKCHGKKEHAIKTVREQYNTAYDYKVGDLRGIISIKIKKNEFVDNINNQFKRNLFTAITVYFLFLLAIYLMIRIIVKNENRYVNTLEEKVAEQVNEIRQRDNSLIKQSKMAEMGEMIGNIAHQWRQPLSIISTSASGVKLQNELQTLNDDLLHESMDNIVKNTQYLSQTIDDFRDFIKGNKELQEFYLSENIDTVLKILHGTLIHNNIKIIEDLDKDIKLKGHPNELIQAVLNIFNNSKDAFNDNSIEDRYIFVKTYQKNNKVIISIRDNAKGIPKNIIDRIFDPYFTTKHKSQGTGLGLFMTHKIIHDSLKGSINVTNETFKYENKTYKGADFIIELPKEL